MSDFINDVYSGVSAGSVSIIGALLLVLIWAFREFLSIIFLRVRKKLFKKSDQHVKSKDSTDFFNRPLIEDHFFFVTIQELIARKIPTITCGCPARTEMLRDMLIDYLTAWYEIFNEFINSEIKRDGFEDRGPRYAEQFVNRISMMLTDLQASINEKWARRGIPDQAIVAFRKWDSKLVECLIIQSEKVAQSAFFSTNRMRLIVIMVQHASFLSTIVNEAKYAVLRMNGSLDGKVYNRKVIEPINQNLEDVSRDSSIVPAIMPKRHGEWKQPSESELRFKRQDPG